MQQGDILQKTAQLKDALNAAHAYYAEAPDYTHFMVLTQSCDLVVRQRRKPKSRYITLAAVRPFSVLAKRIIEKHKIDIDFPLTVCQRDFELSVKNTLERLLHNTEDGYFFIRALSHPNIHEDLCVFLCLSVALRIDHYEACVSSKIAQLNEIFQAKIGWLVGNIYSRVGTPDLEEHESDPDTLKDQFYQEAMYKSTAWLSSAQLKKLKALVRKWRIEHPGEEMTTAVAQDLIALIPKPIDIVAERAVEQLASAELLPRDSDALDRARNILRNDGGFQRLVRQVV